MMIKKLMAVSVLIFSNGCDINTAQTNTDTAVTQVTSIDTRVCMSETHLANTVADERRSDANRARDHYRHPQQVLNFFAVKSTDTVVEIWPSGGWWTEILAPYLSECGEYIAAGFSLEANRTPNWRKNVQRQFNVAMQKDVERFANVQVTGLSVPEDIDIRPAGGADMVLTFRNVHNWMNGDYAEQMFAVMFDALRPGGILGLVEHRALPGTSMEQMLKSGYVTEEHVITLAEAAGFKLLEKSEINANPKDTKNYPAGVWSLPPGLRLGEEDRAKYELIGESDRMTLKFQRPPGTD